MNSNQNRLRMKIRSVLSECTPLASPKFCAMIKTKEGYRKAEEMIISYAIKNNVSISASIGHLESELD